MKQNYRPVQKDWGRRSPTAALTNITCSSLMQLAQSIMPTVRLNENNAPDGSKAYGLDALQSCVLLRPQPQKRPSKRPNKKTASSSEPLEFAFLPANMTLKSQPTYRFCILYGILTTIMHNAVCVLDTKAGKIIVQSEMVLQE